MPTDSNSVTANPTAVANGWGLRVQYNSSLTEGSAPKAASPQGAEAARAAASVKAECLLPKCAFSLKNLPSLLPPYLSAQLKPSDQQWLAQSNVGLTVDGPTTVRILLAPVGADTPAQKGVQAGFLAQVGQAILAVVAVVWGVLCALMPFQCHTAAAAPVPAPGERPLALSITPSQTLKGTCNGVPAWVAHQEIKGVNWDVSGQGTLVGNLKLLNCLSLPGLQSALLPPFLRLVVPKLDLRVAQQVADGLNAWPGAAEHIQVLETKAGGLSFALSSQSQVLGPLAGHGLRLQPEGLTVRADGTGAAVEGAVVATLTGAAPYNTAVRLQGNMNIVGDLHGGVLSVDRPLAVEAAFGMGHQGTTEKAFAPVDVLHLKAEYDGQNLLASVTGGASAGDEQQDEAKAARQAIAARARAQLAYPFVGKLPAAWWASSEYHSLSVATGDAVQDLDASKEAFLKQFLLKARAPEVLPEVSPTPSPASGLEAGTPSLVNELNSCSSSTASLSTLVESEVSADDDGQGKALPRQIEIL